MSTHTPPIVPHVLYVADQNHPWKLAQLSRLKALYHTPTTIRVELGTLRGGKSAQETKQQYHVWCLPDEASWEKVQAARAQLQQAIDLFADYLRLLGSYAKRLDEAGGIKKAPNPLCATVIGAPDPDDKTHSYYVSQPVPRLYRKQVTSHTPKMLRGPSGYGEFEHTFSQGDHFVCPSDDHWQMIEQRQQAAQEAYEAWQALLRELGTYQDALADGRYTRPQAAPVVAQAAPTTTVARNAVWHNLPPLLAGWRWIGEQTDPRKPPIAQLQAPDGWQTARHPETDSNPAIAEALRHVHSQKAALPAVVEPAIVGVAMMDAQEAREMIDAMRGDLGQIDLSLSSFRQRALEFADRQGWKALGYSSSAEAINAELGTQYSKSYLSRLLNAAKIEKLLELPTGQPEPIPERTLRPLTGLDSPDQQRQAWQAAQAAAGGATPTTAQVEQAVEQIKPPVRQELDQADLLVLSKTGWDRIGAPRQKGSTTFYTFRHGGTHDERELAAGEVPLWAAEEQSRTERIAHERQQLQVARTHLDIARGSNLPSQIRQQISDARRILFGLHFVPRERESYLAEAGAILAELDQRDAPVPPVETRGRQIGPGQPEPARWPEAPEGWRWNRKGAPAHLIGPDGWRTADYNYPERALAEAQRRILSMPKPAPAAEPAPAPHPAFDWREVSQLAYHLGAQRDRADAWEVWQRIGHALVFNEPRLFANNLLRMLAGILEHEGSAAERWVEAGYALIEQFDRNARDSRVPTLDSEGIAAEPPTVPDLVGDAPPSFEQIATALQNLRLWAVDHPDADRAELNLALAELHAMSNDLDSLSDGDVSDEAWERLSHAIGDFSAELKGLLKERQAVAV